MRGRMLLLLLVIVQIVVVIGLGINIYSRTKVLGITSVNPINKSDLLFESANKLKYFYEPLPNSNLKNSRFGSEYTINSDSLNDRYEYSVKKNRNVFRIVAIGDSYTYGLYVNTEYNWPEKLEDKLSDFSHICNNKARFEVINLGVQGYDVAYSTYRYFKRGAKYDPDLLIWLLVDPLRDTEKIGEISESLRDNAKNPNSEDWIAKAHEIQRKYFKEPKQTEKELDYLNDFLNITANNSKEILFIMLPHTSNYWRGKILKKLTLSNKVRYFILRDIFSLNGSFLPEDMHPNEKGHQIIAEDVYNYLVSKKLIPCN